MYRILIGLPLQQQALEIWRGEDHIEMSKTVCKVGHWWAVILAVLCQDG